VVPSTQVLSVKEKKDQSLRKGDLQKKKQGWFDSYGRVLLDKNALETCNDFW
jgi:hypothetical protein